MISFQILFVKALYKSNYPAYCHNAQLKPKCKTAATCPKQLWVSCPHLFIKSANEHGATPCHTPSLTYRPLPGLHIALFAAIYLKDRLMQKRTLRIFILTLIKDAYCPLRVFFQIFFFQQLLLLLLMLAKRVWVFNLLLLVCPADWLGSMPKKRENKKNIYLFRVTQKL